MHRTQSIIQEFSQGDYTLNNYPRRFDLKFVHHWLAKAACSSAVIPERLLERTIKNSFFWGVNHTSGAQVGFGRVQKDYATFDWVTDVFIIDEHRGHGLAAFLMEKMMAHPNMHATGRWLLGADHIHGLYRKFGFTNLENPKKIPQPAPRNMVPSGQNQAMLDDFLRDQDIAQSSQEL